MTKHFLVPKKSILSPPTFFRGIGQEFDEVFDLFFREVLSDKQCLKDKISNKIQYPKSDVYFCEKPEESTFELVFEVAIPGINQKDINVTLEDSCLSISFEKEKETEVEIERNYIKKELKKSSFQRIWEINKEALPIDNKKEVYSSLKDGILMIKIPIKCPKNEEEKKKIVINVLDSS